MCGIAGIVEFGGRCSAPSLELLQQMAGALRHRGPDAFGVYRDPSVGMVHARLSIIDVATGQQPLTNERETLWIVFNGEIFNYLELRALLIEKGHRFRTKSDTEVILHSFEEWGLSCFQRFNGQWALAIWNSEEKQLLLARDRVGVRPLYLAPRRHGVAFASEVKAIFCDGTVRREINPRGIDQVLTYWSTIAPTTVFDGVEELRPGSVRIYDSVGRHRDHLTWEPRFPESDRQTYALTISEAAEELRARLTQATSLRTLRADVPVGSYLSGGLDSSLIAWMGRQATSGKFRTFSLRFEDAEFDETEYQRAMAERMDSEHEEVIVTRGDIARVFPDVIRHTERPILRTAPAPMFLLSRLVRGSGIKAVLTGEGADEMLAGYDLFKEAKIREFWARDPYSRLRPALFDRLYPYLARSPQQTRGLALEFWRQGLDKVDQPGFSHFPRWNTTAQIKRFFSNQVKDSLRNEPAPSVLDLMPNSFRDWDGLARAQYLENVTLLSGYLLSSQGDRMLMAHSVEGRFPFLDYDVMTFCNQLPASYKLLGLNEKFILKKIARGIIPDLILKRTKQPYRSPDAASFFGDRTPAYVHEFMGDSAVRRVGVFDPHGVSALYDKCRRQLLKGNGLLSNVDNMGFVAILSTQLLHHCFIGGRSSNPGKPVIFSTIFNRGTTTLPSEI